MPKLLLCSQTYQQNGIQGGSTKDSNSYICLIVWWQQREFREWTAVPLVRLLFVLSLHPVNFVFQTFSFVAGHRRRSSGTVSLATSDLPGFPLASTTFFGRGLPCPNSGSEISFSSNDVLLAGGSLVQIPTLRGSEISHSLPTTFFWQGAPLSKFRLGNFILFQRRSFGRGLPCPNSGSENSFSHNDVLLAGGSLVQIPTLRGSEISHSLSTSFFGRGLPRPNSDSSRLGNLTFSSNDVLWRGAPLPKFQLFDAPELIFSHSLASNGAF